MFVSAKDLQNDGASLQRKKKQQLYDMQLDMCFAEIKRTHTISSQTQAVLYTVPWSLIDHPYYDYRECVAFLKDSLKSAGFYCRLCKPGNRVFVSWNPKDTGKLTDDAVKERSILIEFDKRDPRSMQEALERLQKLGIRGQKLH